jgi:hypothetical protein
MARETYARHLATGEGEAIHRPRYVYFAVAAASAEGAEHLIMESADSLTTISVPAQLPGGWQFHVPPIAASHPLVRRFTGSLRPETRGQRATVIAAAVRKRQSEFKGSIDVDWLSGQTGFPLVLVRRAIRDLCAGGEFRKYLNNRGVECIETAPPSARHEKLRGKTLSERKSYYLRTAAGATLAWVFTLLATRAIHLVDEHKKAGFMLGWAAALVNRVYSDRKTE